MYKFEISADSPQELREKMLEFASEMQIIEQNKKPEYIDEAPEVAPAFVQPYVAPMETTFKGYVAPVVQTPVSSDTQTVDAKGLPYDARIHASSRTFVKDGTWRYKKGVSDAEIASVEAQLKGQTPQQTPVIIPAVPTTTVHVEMPKFNPDCRVIENAQGEREYPPLSAIVNPVATPSQPAPVAYENIVVPQYTKPAHSFETFKNNLMVVFAELINEGKIDHKYVEELKAYFQVKEIWNILADNLKCIELFNTFVKIGLITKVD